jgi:ABC-type amino acid transport substrate-binding protein
MKTAVSRKFPATVGLLIICLSAGLLVQCTKPQPPATGKDQLVAALDAAFIRILASGKWREITKPLGPLAINMADCYPTPENAPFPENPAGALADILNNKKIRVGSYPDKYSGSFNVYTEANVQLMRAMLDELGAGYKLSAPIAIEHVYIDPPSSSTLFKQLNEGAFDISDLNSALGGVSNSLRRRIMARFTCTIFGSGWFLQVKENSPYKTIDDFQADPKAKLCSGMLSSQLGKDYFVNQQITSQYENDIELCGQGVLDGTYDAYLHFDPAPVKSGLRSIDTGIVSGVPLWVAGGADSAE